MVLGIYQEVDNSVSAQEADVIVYSAKMCSDCQILKKWCDDRGVKYETRDIRENLEYGVELEKETGKLGVPYLKFEDEWIRGYDLTGPFTDAFIQEIFDRKGVVYSK